MFNLAEFGAAGKRLNKDFLESLPDMACKVTITGGGVANFKDGTKSPFLTVTGDTFEGEKELILNATNRNMLGVAFGKQPDAWKGRLIGVYFDPTVSMGGKPVGGVRVQILRKDPFAPPAGSVVPAAVAAEQPPF